MIERPNVVAMVDGARRNENRVNRVIGAHKLAWGNVPKDTSYKKNIPSGEKNVNSY